MTYRYCAVDVQDAPRLTCRAESSTPRGGNATHRMASLLFRLGWRLLQPVVCRALLQPLPWRTLLPLSALAGAWFMILADLAARTVLTPVEVPVGVVTAFVGGPFFLFLLQRRKREVF